jgi:hypothetical protein
MLSPYLLSEETIINMAKALKPLSDEWLQYASTRKLAYLKAGICAKDMKRFDGVARDREVLRRLVMGADRKSNAA